MLHLLTTFIVGIARLALGLAACVAISAKAQFLDHAKIRFTSQLINVINFMCTSKVLQKMLKCFNGTKVLRSFLVFVFFYSMFSPFSWFVFDVFPVMLSLYLKDSEFVLKFTFNY